MPILEKVIIQNWRNIELQELAFSPNMNCICGNNGEGKTNLLDAIYYLSMTKSAFGPSDKYNFKRGTSEFALSGSYLMESGANAKFSIKVNTEGEKKMLRNGKAYTKISEHIGCLPIVKVSPSDTALISEGGEERRKFVSGVLSQIDREHLGALQSFNRMLSQRNALLKTDNCKDDILESIDYTLAHYAEKIHSDRKSFTERIKPLVQKYYEMLSDCKEKVDISYQSDLFKGPYMELLKSTRTKDRLFQYTTIGTQRDDFIFMMDGDPIRKIGSQGQQKCFLVALKFAQYELMKEIYGYPPTLLLDDLFDKLDLNRTENLLQMVCGEEFGQIFISDTNKSRLHEIVDKYTAQSMFYEVKNGVFLL